MTVDLLSQRLKAAKRELTNLKTAHSRGFGLLKVYKETIYFSQTELEEGYIYSNASVTIKFSKEFPPNPFVYVLGDISMEYGREPAFVPKTIEFSDGGYTVVIGGEVIYYISERLRLEKITAFSTAPIISIGVSAQNE